MREALPKRWASVYANERFLRVETRSGYRGGLPDPAGYRATLLFPVASDELGTHLKMALAASRWIHPDNDPDFFKRARDYAVTYEEWLSGLMAGQGYKSKRALFKGMKLVSIESSQGSTLMVPMVHVKLEAWGRERGDGIENVRIADTSDDAAFGAALCLALERAVG